MRKQITIIFLAFLTTSAYSWAQEMLLTVIISKDYLEIWAYNNSLPKLFYKEQNANLWALHKESEEELGKIKMSVYSKSDSAYLDINNKFITELSVVKPGAIVKTISKNSARKLACGQSGPDIEDICSNGMIAITLKPRSVYDELAWHLIMIPDLFSNRLWADDSSSNEIIILIDEPSDINVAFSKIVNVIDRAKAAGFYKIKIRCDIDNDIACGKIAKIKDMAKKAGYHIQEPEVTVLKPKYKN